MINVWYCVGIDGCEFDEIIRHRRRVIDITPAECKEHGKHKEHTEDDTEEKTKTTAHTLS